MRVLLLALPAWYAEQGPSNCRASVCLSVRPVTRPPDAAAAGLLLWTRQAGDINRLLHSRRSSAAAPQHGAQQQMRAVPRCQPLRA